MESTELGIFRLQISQLEKELTELKNSNTKNEDNTQKKLDRLNQSMIEVLRFMSAQEEKNIAAEKERDRIFKASTLLPVAILTALINVGMNMVVKPSSPEMPSQPTYVIPYRDEQRGVSRLELKRDED